MILGLDIARRASAPARWIAPIQSYEIVDGKAYTLEHDGTYHFNSIHDLVQFDPADNIGTLGNYYRVPADMVEYIYKEAEA